MSPVVITSVQTISGLAWLLPLVLFTPSVWRVWSGKAAAVDVICAPLAFVALLQIGFIVRWLVFPHAIGAMVDGELAMWAGLYFMSALSALGLLLAYRAAARLW